MARFDQLPSFDNGNSVLTLLYEAYGECNHLDDAQIKADFNELHRHMNGMELREMDYILDPVCSLCRDLERDGFWEGVSIGFSTKKELDLV